MHRLRSVLPFKRFLSARPLVPVVFAFAAGAAFAQLLPLSVRVTYVLALLAGVLLFFILFSINKAEYSVPAVLLLGFFCAGALLAQQALGFSHTLVRYDGEKMVVEGKVVGCREYGQRQEITIKATSISTRGVFETRGKVLAVFYERETNLLPGDWVKVTGKAAAPKLGGNPGEFDYRAYLVRQGISVRIIGEESTLVQPGSPSLMRAMAVLKHRTRQNLLNIIGRENTAVIAGMLFGEKDMLDRQQRQLYGNMGIMHIFAVSGFHTGVLAGAVIMLSSLLLGAIGGGRGRSITAGQKALAQLVILTGILLCYAALAGFSASVVRASIMIVIGLAAHLLGRRRDFYSALAAAALVWLAFHPLDVFDVGTQLSFAAAWGIYYLHPVFTQLLSFLPAWRNILVVPLAAQAALLPLLAFYFGTVPLLGIAANILVMPLAAIIIILGLTALPLQLAAQPAAELLFYSAAFIASLISHVLSLIAMIPFAYTPAALPSSWQILAYYLVLVLGREWMMAKREASPHREKLGRTALALVLLSLLLSWLPLPAPLEVTFLDVGQGDSAVIIAGGKTVLVDAAGGGYAGFEVGRDRLVPALQRLGVKEIDLFINSHADRDHVGGLEAVAEQFAIGAAVLPRCAGEPAQEQQGLVSMLERKGTVVAYMSQGDTIFLGAGVEMEVLHPVRQVPHGWDSNEQSLVFLLRHGSNSFLFTGDIEEDGLDALLSVPGGAVSVLKVAHHGSANSFSVDFYRQYAPKYAVISVGANNFGHPSPSVLSFLAREEVSVYRTDVHGAVTFLSDGNGLGVSTNNSVRNQ